MNSDALAVFFYMTSLNMICIEYLNLVLFVFDYVFFFFFSSRRRHTRCSRDWSSDVCSSDLPVDEHRRDRDGGNQGRQCNRLSETARHSGSVERDVPGARRMGSGVHIRQVGSVELGCGTAVDGPVQTGDGDGVRHGSDVERRLWHAGRVEGRLGGDADLADLAVEILAD